MGYPSLRTATIREMITSAVDVIVQASRLRDGSRKIVDVALVAGMDDGRVLLERLFRLDHDARGESGAQRKGRYVRGVGLTGMSREKAVYHGLDARIDAALDQL